MEKNHVEFAGQLSSEVRIQLIELIEVVNLANPGLRGDLRRLCNIAIELLDNAQRYGNSQDVKFDWYVEGLNLVVTITNRANRTDAERLMKTVEEINGMTAEEVAAAFLAQLNDDSFGEKGGAGLGMLQIAKRTGGKINASVEEVAKEDFLCTSWVSARLK